jgi:uncharacterized protein (DUF488 family)
VLARSLSSAGIAYRHFPALGGLRKPRPNSNNTAWKIEGFRGYADYMETDAFKDGLADLVSWAGREERVAITCAEAVWWRCHRRLIADALVARGIGVGHIMSPARAARHALTEFARVSNGDVSYPGLV